MNHCTHVPATVYAITIPVTANVLVDGEAAMAMVSLVR
jgi:hypothetical protein